MSRVLHPQFTFADLEWGQPAISLDPTLQAVSDFLDRQQSLVEKVRQDLERGLKKPNAGRAGITPPQVLRSLALMRIKNWKYRELRERIDDGLSLRSFTQFNSGSVPKHKAFNEAFGRLTPETMRGINQVVVRGAVELGLEDGKALRVDVRDISTRHRMAGAKKAENSENLPCVDILFDIS